MKPCNSIENIDIFRNTREAEHNYTRFYLKVSEYPVDNQYRKLQEYISPYNMNIWESGKHNEKIDK